MALSAIRSCIMNALETYLKRNCTETLAISLIYNANYIYMYNVT